MFNITIALVSILLVIVMSITTVYYLNDVAKSSKHFVVATTYNNQASQLFAGAQLYYLDNLRWASSPAELVPKYINTLPVPPLEVAGRSSVAMAQSSQDWSFSLDKSGTLTYIVFATAVQQQPCGAVVLRNATGGRDEPNADLMTTTIPEDIDPAKVVQCVQDLKWSGENEGNSYFWLTPNGGDVESALNAYNLAKNTDYSKGKTGKGKTGMKFCTKSYSCLTGGVSAGALKVGQKVLSWYLPSVGSVQAQEAPATIPAEHKLFINTYVAMPAPAHYEWVEGDVALASALGCAKAKNSNETTTVVGNSVSGSQVMATCQMQEIKYPVNQRTTTVVAGQNFYTTAEAGYGTPFTANYRGCNGPVCTRNNTEPPFPIANGACQFQLVNGSPQPAGGNCLPLSAVANSLSGNGISVCGGATSSTGFANGSTSTGTVSMPVCRGGTGQMVGTCQLSFVGGAVAGINNCPSS